MDWLGVDRHRLGTGLLVFGIVGFVLATAVAVGLIGGALAARGVDDRITADQVRLVEMLNRLGVTIDRLASSTDHASETLATTRDLVVEAGTVLVDVGTTTRSLADALDISILGSQPFAGAAANLRGLSDRVETFATHTTALGGRLDTNAADLADLADRTRAMGDDLAAVTARLDAFDRTGAIVGLVVAICLLGGLLTVWVGVAAALSAWAGLRLRRLALGRPDQGVGAGG
jgi:hypothetical protein